MNPNTADASMRVGPTSPLARRNAEDAVKRDARQKESRMSKYFDVQMSMTEDGERFPTLYLPRDMPAGGDYHGFSPEDAEKLGMALIVGASRARELTREYQLVAQAKNA